MIRFRPIMLTALAVGASKRSRTVPDVPTVIESGIPGFTADTWTGVLAPRGTPPAIVNRLHAEVVKMVKDTDMKERLLGLGADPVGNTPEQFRTLIQNEINKWTRVIRTVGIKEEV